MSTNMLNIKKSKHKKLKKITFTTHKTWSIQIKEKLNNWKIEKMNYSSIS